MKPETQVSDVAERLRNEAQRTSHEWNLAHSHMCEEAADLIERQQKEIARLREGLSILADPNSYGAAIDVSTAPFKVKVSTFAQVLLDGGVK